MSSSQPPITQLLQHWQQGTPHAQEALFSAVYQQLQRLAEARMREERAGHTLQPTGLVNEAWMRMAGADLSWENRSHFFGVASRLMRQVLVDHARARGAQRRQAGIRIDLTDAQSVPDPEQGADAMVNLLALHEALETLATLDARRAQVVEMRYFGGLERPEIAQALGISERMVKRDLMLAQAWLRRALASASDDSASAAQAEPEAKLEGDGGDV